MGADVGGRSSHAKEHSHSLRQAGYESISDLPRIQQSYRENALVVIPPAMRICASIRRRAKSSGVDSGSARTVTETATA